MKVLKKVLQKNKIQGFLGIPWKYKKIIIRHLFNRGLGLKSNLKNLALYRFVNYLWYYRGSIIDIEAEFFIGRFRDLSSRSIKLRILPSSDLDVFHQIFLWQEYQKVVDVFKSKFGYDSGKKYKIVDAGANIGLTSIFFLEKFNTCEIVCLEPDKSNFEILNFNLNCSSTQEVFKMNAALWPVETKMEIINDFRDKSDWAKRVRMSGNNEGVDALSLNKILKDFNWRDIDVLKIDIEGAEKELFLDENTDLNFLKITRCIAIEIHDEFNCRTAINNIFKEYGFEYFRFGELTIAINKNLV